MSRTDLHKPSAFTPANYEPLFDYHCATQVDGWPIPAYRLICPDGACCKTEGRLTGLCCTVAASTVAHLEGRDVFGEPGHCGSCGARFVYGQLWRHTPTGAIVHLGHDCAEKYDLMMDTSASELAMGRAKRAVATQIQRAVNEQERAAFLDANIGLAAALELADSPAPPHAQRSHAILTDLRAKFLTYRTMSDKQVALAIKLAGEITAPPEARVEVAKVEAPTGKGIVFAGEIVGAKIQHGEWGSTWKITVRVTTDAGEWLAWGSAPRSLMDEVVEVVDKQAGSGYYRDDARANAIAAALKGRRVRLSATLERPAARDASEMETDQGRAKVEARNAERHFVFMRRPSEVSWDWDPSAPKPKRATKAQVIRAFANNLAGL